ncbi:MAG: hypothetical protein KC502_23655, partial [Myxococcales bacterium]|nr:hypothetical protein [Myxococcales bacterium]
AKASRVIFDIRVRTDRNTFKLCVASPLAAPAPAASPWSTPAVPECNLAENETGDREARTERLERLLETNLVGNGAEAIWRTVETNLRTESVRLVFGADRIPGKRRRIIEFLSEQPVSTQVVGLEPAQYLAESHKSLSRALSGAPRLCARRRLLRRDRTGRRIGRRYLLAPPSIGTVLAGIPEEAERSGIIVDWGSKWFSVSTPQATHDDRIYFLHGHAPRPNGRQFPAVQEYVRSDACSQDEAAARRKALAEVASSIRAGGEFTMELAVDADGLHQIDDMLQMLWSWERGARVAHFDSGDG